MPIGLANAISDKITQPTQKTQERTIPQRKTIHLSSDKMVLGALIDQVMDDEEEVILFTAFLFGKDLQKCCIKYMNPVGWTQRHKSSKVVFIADQTSFPSSFIAYRCL